MNRDYFVRLRIGKENLRRNYDYFRSKLKPETKLLVLVKANSYGHGAVEFAHALGLENVDYFGVAHPIEGVELREGGVNNHILVLTAGYDNFETIVEHNLEPSIPTIFALKELNKVLEAKNIKDYPVHIKIDTGMHRLGFMEKEFPELLEFLSSKECRVKVQGAFTHLAVSDDPKQDEFTLGQLNLYIKLADRLEKCLGYKFIRHTLNSAGIERFSEYQFDMVRLGIGIYGISAVKESNAEPAAALECKILQIKELNPEDGTVGYGRWGKITRPSRIATIPLGYADGLNRHYGRGNVKFAVNGVLVPTIGNICMDMCMLDVTDTDAKVGDVVTVFGKNPKASDHAKVLDTIPYEIFTSVSHRVPRFIDDKL